MSDKNSNNGRKDNQNHYLSLGIIFGLLGGALFSSIIGMVFESALIWSLGPGLGMLIGIIIGVIMDKNTKAVKRDVTKIFVIVIIGVILILLVPKIIGYL